jgi:hypothetical protein
MTLNQMLNIFTVKMADIQRNEESFDIIIVYAPNNAKDRSIFLVACQIVLMH